MQQPNFININNHLINLNNLKLVKYWKHREMLEISLIGDRRFYFYIPQNQSGFIMLRLQEAIVKKKEKFHFHFNKNPPKKSYFSCFFPFYGDKSDETGFKEFLNEIK